MSNIEKTTELKNINLNNFFYGIFKTTGSGDEIQDFQNRLIKIVKSNGANIERGLITSVIDIDKDTNVVTMQIGFLTNAHISDLGGFNFEESYRLDNVVSFDYRGSITDFNVLFSEFSERLKNESNIKLTGRVYNLIRYMSKSDNEIDASIYMATSEL